MDQSTLVGPALEEGKQLVEAADRFGLQIEAAFWWLENDNWKLLLATPLVSTEGPRSVYLKLSKAVRESGLSRDLFERTSVLSPSSGVVTILDISAQRIPYDRLVLRESVGGVYVEGAYFYRFAPSSFDNA